MRPRRPTELTLDGLTFAVRWSTRRRTVGITVERDGHLRLAAPARCSRRALEAAARTRLGWVRRKLAEYEAMGPPPSPPCFQQGERLPYLGRAYRLDIAERPEQPFSLVSGRFVLAAPGGAAARPLVAAWYTQRSLARLPVRIEHFVPAVGAAPQTTRVRDLGKRWGTCNSRTRTLDFHWQLLTLPPELVDYVVVHELAHLREPNHGPGFWALVADVLPDCRERRLRLRDEGSLRLI